MKTSFPRFIAPVFFAAAVFSCAADARAQAPSASSLRSTQTVVEQSDVRAQSLIDKAENYFNLGELNLKDNKLEAARADYDRAVDAILDSGMDVRANPRLRTYYLELVERIYRREVPIQQAQPAATTNTTALIAQNNTRTTTDAVNPPPAPQIGFRQQKFEPSPLDELSKLELTSKEREVTPEATAELEQAKSAVDFGFRSNALIQQFINYYQGRGRATMETGLRRSGRYMRMARKIFREEGVPEDIAWLGQVESAWRPTAYSSAAASGLWQFIPSTGARFGLRQTAWVDERNSYEKATRASARYLKWLALRYNGNWELAMGAYNTGEGNIDRAISRAGSSDFWRIYPYIAQETRNYVPNILATILIAKNPEKFGFRVTQRDTPVESTYDVVRVPNATSLQFIADAADTSVDYLRSLNPELRRDVTPRGEAYNVRVPAGKSKQFVALLNRVPAGSRESARAIRVNPNENLQSVAARTGTSVAQLQVWNGGADATSDGRVVVPGNSVRRAGMIYERRTAGTSSAATGSNLVRVRATAGDTIAKIAARHNASSEEVARLNNIAANASLQAGQEITVPSRASAAPSSRRRR